MLGLADRTRIIDLFEALMRGDMAAALARAARRNTTPAPIPAVVLADLAEFTHFVTRVKIVPAVADDLSLAEAERTRGRAFAEKLSMRVLARTWQMLLKGMTEVQERRPAGRRRRDGAGAHRLCGRPADARRGDPRARRATAPRHAALARNGNGGGAGASAASRAALRAAARRGAARRAARGACAGRAAVPGDPPPRSEPAPAAPALVISRFEDLIALAARSATSASRPRSSATCGWCASRTAGSRSRWSRARAKTLVNDLARKFSQWTGRRWMVVVSAEAGAADRASRRTTRAQAELKTGVRADPLVQAVLARFPGAEIVERARRRAPRRAAAPPDDGDDAMPEPPPVDDDSPTARLARRTMTTTTVRRHARATR